MLSVQYLYISVGTHVPATEVWVNDLHLRNQDSLCKDIWDNIVLASRNPNHQMIHWKFFHRLYLTPLRCFHMRLNSSPVCTLCRHGSTGTFIHYFWDCPDVAKFWKMVATDLSSLLNQNVTCSPLSFLLNDDSTLFH